MAMRFQCSICDTVFTTTDPENALCPIDSDHDGFIFLGEDDGPAVLTQMEKAYFESIRDPKNKVILTRMTLDGKDVAVICQSVTGTTIPGVAYMPLAVILDDDDIKRLRMFDGEEPVTADPSDVIALSKAEPDDTTPDNLDTL